MTNELIKSVKNHFKKWGGLYLASIFWAFVFKQIARLPYKSLEMGGTDYWGWLLFSFFALVTGWMIGNKDNKNN